MDGNVRTIVYTVSDYGDKEPEEFTLRDAVEWFKKVGREVPEANFAEQKYLNQRWAHMCTVIAKREGVPPGYMSYLLNELAVNELQMTNSAVVEAEQVT